MGLDFLLNHGARRMRHYESQPFLLDDAAMEMDEDEADARIHLGYEAPPDEWEPRRVGPCDGLSEWPLRPLRFLDGKDVGRTVAWLQSQEGFPVPVRLAEIGAVAMRNAGG